MAISSLSHAGKFGDGQDEVEENASLSLYAGTLRKAWESEDKVLTLRNGKMFTLEEDASPGEYGIYRPFSWASLGQYSSESGTDDVLLQGYSYANGYKFCEMNTYSGGPVYEYDVEGNIISEQPGYWSETVLSVILRPIDDQKHPLTKAAKKRG